MSRKLGIEAVKVTSEMKAEFLASICVAEEGAIEDEITAILHLSRICDDRLRYWEILYVVSEDRREEIESLGALLSDARNLRIILANRDLNHYRCRALAASEAIGDVVVISAFAELGEIDPITFAQKAYSDGRISMAHRPSGGSGPFYMALRLISHFKVDGRDLKTIAFPRELLSPLLTRPTVAIDLRFEAKRSASRYVRHNVGPALRVRSGPKVRRFDLLSEIISTSSSRFLKGYAALSLSVSAIAGCYGLYALAVYTLSPDVQPGWFSNALAQAGIACYLGLGLTIFALGLARMGERAATGIGTGIVEEIGNTTFFDYARQLNVELAMSEPEPMK